MFLFCTEAEYMVQLGPVIKQKKISQGVSEKLIS